MKTNALNRAVLVILALLLCAGLYSCSKKGDNSSNDVKYTLSYDDGAPDADIAIPSPQSAEKGSAVMIANAIEREYYVFAGWYDGVNTYKPGDNYILTQNICLVALWEIDDRFEVSLSDLDFRVGDDGTSVLVGIKEGVDDHALILSVPEKDNEGNKVTAIADNAFESNDRLVRINIPSSVKSIGKKAFANCGNVKEIFFSEGLESIGEYAFYYNPLVSEIKLPDSLKELGAHSFRNCNSLRKVSFGEGLTEISESAFRGCSRLEAVSVCKGLERVAAYAFDGCNSLRTVLYPLDESAWQAIDFETGNENFKKAATFTI